MQPTSTFSKQAGVQKRASTRMLQGKGRKCTRAEADDNDLATGRGEKKNDPFRHYLPITQGKDRCNSLFVCVFLRSFWVLSTSER